MHHIRSFLLVAVLLTAVSTRASSDETTKGGVKAGTGAFRDIIVLFNNHMWDVDHVDRFVRIFFTRDQVLAGMKGLEGFERASSNKHFADWLRGLRQPGFHVYGEGFRDLGPLVTRLLETKPGWICCGPMGSVLRTSEVRAEKATEEQLEQVRKSYPEIDPDKLYFQMQEIAHKVRIWIHQAYRPPRSSPDE